MFFITVAGQRCKQTNIENKTKQDKTLQLVAGSSVHNRNLPNFASSITKLSYMQGGSIVLIWLLYIKNIIKKQPLRLVCLLLSLLLRHNLMAKQRKFRLISKVNYCIAKEMTPSQHVYYLYKPFLIFNFALCLHVIRISTKYQLPHWLDELEQLDVCLKDVLLLFFLNILLMIGFVQDTLAHQKTSCFCCFQKWQRWEEIFSMKKLYLWGKVPYQRWPGASQFPF